MGRQDNWHTPKALKIERAGEPRQAPRSRLSKRDKKKGAKARLDEVLSAHQSLRRAKDYMAQAEVRQESDSWWVRHIKESLDRAQARYDELVAACKRDGMPYDR